MIYNITERVTEAWGYFDNLLSERIKKISAISGCDKSQFVKINPVDFLEKNKYQQIDGYQYRKIQNYIVDKKTRDDIFLISPCDEVNETAAQCSYKSNIDIKRVLRASKCEVVPCSKETALDFFIKNHRQTPPLVRETCICFALVNRCEIVAIILYDISNGAVRGKKKNYELVRLAIKKGVKVHGGASKLQKACEKTLKEMGEHEIYSYSNATINSGAVYRQLGFTESKIEGGAALCYFREQQNNKVNQSISNIYQQETCTTRVVKDASWRQ